MLPKSGGSLTTGASGGYNATFRSLAQTLVARGHATDVVRLGWEMNGSWYSWSAARNPAAFVAYWRQTVTTMRAVPGQAFRFERAPNLGEGTAGFDVTTACPGDAYVDIIGVSFDDGSWKCTSAQYVESWSFAVTQRFGLQWHVDSARAVTATAAATTPTTWTSSATGWRRTTTSTRATSTVTRGPASSTPSKAPRRSRRGRRPTSPAWRALAELDDGAGLLEPDGSGARALDGVGVTGKIYVFVTPGVTASRVRFWLADTSMRSTPRTTEVPRRGTCSAARRRPPTRSRRGRRRAGRTR